MCSQIKCLKDGIGQGGPIEGFDISVYHIETDFILGYEVDGKTTDKKIWPVCHPKVNKLQSNMAEMAVGTCSFAS